MLNKTVVDRIFPEGYEIPNTTDELIRFCNEIKAEGVYPFSISTSISYWDYLHWVWWAQYAGYDNYIDYYWGYYQKEQPDGTTVRTLAENGEVLGMPGRLESVKVAENLLKKENGYMHKYADSMTWQEAQIAFVGQGYAGQDMTESAMMVNGQWLENEVQSYLLTKPQDLVMIKTPVISFPRKNFGKQIDDGRNAERRNRRDRRGKVVLCRSFRKRFYKDFGSPPHGLQCYV